MKITEQEARDLLSAITCYLLCDFGVQDVEIQAQNDAEKERILKIQEKLKRFVDIEQHRIYFVEKKEFDSPESKLKLPGTIESPFIGV
jgi:hypothetical protein